MIPRTLIALALLAMLSGCADGPAISSDSAAGTLPSGQPIPVEGDGDIGDGTTTPASPAEAPDFGLSSEVDSESASPYTSCWSADGRGVCSDGIPQPDAVRLAADTQLVVTYAEGELTAGWSTPIAEADPAQSSADQQPLPVTRDNPGIWLVDVSDVPAGAHVVWLAWAGPEGDAFTAVTVTVDH